MKTFNKVTNQANIWLTHCNSKNERAAITSILNSTGTITHNPQDINDVFHKFYSSLYSSDHDPDQSKIDNFLNNLNLPTLPREHARIFVSPLPLRNYKTPLIKCQKINQLNQLNLMGFILQTLLGFYIPSSHHPLSLINTLG